MDDNENKEEIKQDVIENTVKEEPKKVEAQTTTKEPQKDRKGLAIAAMVLGIISLVLFCVWFISIPCAILAIIFGILSLKSTGRGMAIAGISTGAVGFILMIILYAFIFIVDFGTYSAFQDIIDDYENHNYNYNYHYDRHDDFDDWF